jgi:hypothetical protein
MEQIIQTQQQVYLQSVLAVVLAVRDLQFLVAQVGMVDSQQVEQEEEAQLKLEQLLVQVALVVQEWQ